MPDTTDTKAQVSDLAAAISRLTVQTTRGFSGRGPEKVHTSIAPHVITVVLRDTLTKSERLLAEGGRGEAVIALRREIQQIMRPTLIAGIERLTGRAVDGFFSDHQIEPDIATETFVLGDPIPGAPASDG